jgi:hypothetical protein
MRWTITIDHAEVTGGCQRAGINLPETVMVPRLAMAASFAILVFPAPVGAQTDTNGPMRHAVIESLQDSQWSVGDGEDEIPTDLLWLGSLGVGTVGGGLAARR